MPKLKKPNPTSRGTWKAFERAVAKMFGTERTPLSGSNSKHTGSDTLHEKLFVECKYRANHAVISLYKETAKKAKMENKIPIVALKEKGDSGFYFLIKAEHFEEVYKHIAR